MTFQLLRQVLVGTELAEAQSLLERGNWRNGRETAGADAARVKHNLQLTPGTSEHAALTELVKQALGRSSLFKQLALPRRVSSPLFSRYDAGMEYGWHTDDAYQAREGVRTDLAVTLFLSDPADYDGGALQVGNVEHRPPAGDLVLYPATSIHRVTRVTRGQRQAAVLWIQSLIRDERQRDVLASLREALALAEGQAQALLLARIQQNLLRLWLEP
ncbi:MAG TPA: Fe2+-dependent dioxygenase [Polyangiaceae bacterium]|nr:Fe2+-dependent dioxygenase [Polyangiaceae bacterium]